MTTRTASLRQIAALPLFVDSKGGMKVCLVTARGSERWIIPKGNPISGFKPHEVAAHEALEEAGLLGRADEHSIGDFQFERRRNGVEASFFIEVYAFWVEGQLRRWAEMSQRQVLHCNLEVALGMVCSPSLAALIGTYVTSTSRGAAADAL